ncbi:MAG TPA: TetR/AcrR family transcriptional regulator [Lacisediminihabitans sp.]|uniref:TetR/AcrR family transcriptional regulator n=1 Tax=Lacisediminihabitans sp. TaxID=2787631 RepID=UPI002EDB3370
MSYSGTVATRGRGRSEQAREAVLRATRDLVAEEGYPRLTIEKIAARAKVGKPTIYRWWQSKNAILAECVLAGEVIPTAVVVSSTESIRLGATAWFRDVLAYIDENAPLLRGLVAATYEDPAIAQQLRAHLGDPIEAALTEWADATGVEEDRPRELSAHTLTQLLFGSILYRLAALDDPEDESREELFDLLITRFLRFE